MYSNIATKAFGPTINRIGDLMEHSDRFAFHGIVRLAQAAGVSHSAVSRLIHQQTSPTFRLVARLTRALEEEFGVHLDPRDLVAEDGGFLHRSVCSAVGCGGCLPTAAYGQSEALQPLFVGVKPGAWVCSQFPHGLAKGKGGE